MGPRGRRCRGCALLLFLSACAERPLGVPVDGEVDALAAWAEPGCPYLTPWTGRSIRFVLDEAHEIIWDAVLHESLPAARERRWWTLSLPNGSARFEEITLEGCGLSSWRGQDEHGGVLTGPYVAEIPPYPREHGEIEQADGSRAVYRFSARARFEDGAARYLDCFQIEIDSEQTGPGRYQDRIDVYCRGVGLIYRSIDGEVTHRVDTDADAR